VALPTSVRFFREPSVFSWHIIIGRCCLGPLSSIAVMSQASEGHYAKIVEDILLSVFLGDKLMENFAIMPSLRGIGFKAKNLKLKGDFPRQRGP